jgi:hypothetical protein
MGDFKIEVNAVGGHGCQRELGHGSEVKGCGRTGCPDCLAREFVAKLKASGNSVSSAVLIHWPGQKEQVTDNLLTGIRNHGF